MRLIYIMTNKINGKVYVGQTNNFQLRMNGHRSDANNSHSRAYNSPLSAAIRKYGWINFDNKIIEEFHDDESCEYVDSREKFFIKHYQSLTSQNGYNISTSGAGVPHEKLKYAQKVVLSKIFTSDQILDIQLRMKAGEKRSTIMKDYPKLTSSFFDNINQGLNFKNENWNYPLHNYKDDLSGNFSINEIHQIKLDIINGDKYKAIKEKWDISYGLISLINNGKQWWEKEYLYPLRNSNHSSVHNFNTWVKDVQNDLINTNLSIREIANKYDKAKSTIQKINSGSSYRNNNYIYPLTSNRT